MRSPSTALAGREAAGAPAVEHELADGLALDEHRVEAVAHGGERVATGTMAGWTRTPPRPSSPSRSAMASSFTT
jgi:hypothetical protein